MADVNVMDIYAEEGHKVMVTEETKDNGWDSDVKKVAKLLELNKPYTIDYTDIGGCHTTVYLKEFPNVRFNSVNFVDCRGDN